MVLRMLSGCYRWVFKDNEGRDGACLKLAFPKTMTASNVSYGYSDDNDDDNGAIREHAIERAIAERYTKKEGRHVLMVMGHGNRRLQSDRRGPKIFLIDRIGTPMTLESNMKALII